MPVLPVIRPTGDLAQASVGASGSETQVLGLIEWSIDWKRKTVDSTTTDDAGFESSQGSTVSWTAKAKFAFLDGDTSQSTNILAALSTPAGATKWNFFNQVATGRASFTGSAWIDGITLASGVGKLVGLDVSLKGTGPLTSVAQIAAIGGEAED